MWRRDGVELVHSDAAPTGLSMPAKQTGRALRTRANFRELYSFTPPGECILVGLELGGEFAEMRTLEWLLLAAGGAVLAIGLAGGWWFSTRAIRPLEDISAAADRIATGDLSRRINVADTDTELGRLAVVLNSTFARLETAFAQQKQFTSDAAHELRTPLSVIFTQVQTALKRERSSAEYHQTLESCQRAAQRMRKLIDSLMELAHYDAGQHQLKHFPFDLGQIAQDCIDLVQPLAEARSIQISAKLPPTNCVGDPERISQVLTNLLTNAIEYNKPGGEVRVEVQSKNGMACVEVADNGPGIPAGELPHLFERFYRVDKSRSARHSGLGLAIAKSIVEAHGGTISVSSQEGAGTTFTFQLPLQRR
jgi:heavy metal sensor kinase